MSLQNAAADAQPSSSRGRSNADEAASKTSKKSQETHALGVTARSNSTAPSSALSGVPANAHASGPLLPPSGPLLPSDTNHSINFSSSTSSARHLLHGNSRQPANFSSAVKKTPSASRQGVVDHPTTPVKIKVENQHLLELKVQAEADYAHLSHFRALLERSELHHSPNSAATVPLNDGGEPVSGDDDTPHNTHALLLDQFMKTLEMRAEAAQARFESALSRERRKPTAKPVFHAISRSDHVNGPLDEYFRSIRREERQAFRSSDRIQYERPSQDDSDHVRDQNGYVQDGFVVDDDLASSMASSAESSDGSLYCDSEAQSIDAAQISRQCLEAVAECYPKRRPAFPLSCEDAKRSTLEGPVSFKTPGRRVVEMELLLSAWVRQRDLDSISHKQLALFFEILHVNEAEFVRSVFKHFIRRFQHLSWKFCSFLWKTVKCCCPQFAPIFSNSWEVYCEDKKHKPSSTRPEQHSKYQDQSDRRAAPRTRRPEIKALEDIKQFMSVFLVDYGKYRRDHENAKFGYDSLFQCLTPAQQKTLSSITSTPIDTCMAMSTEDTCELVRFAYGKKSMASALVLLKATRFSGDALTPADWSRFFQLFSETVQEIHHLAMPPDDKIAKIFLRACPSAFMRNTLLLNKHTTLDEAFAQVNALLHDPAFLRDAHKAAQSDRHDRDHSDAHVRQHRDRHAQRSSPQPHAYAQQQQPAHARPSPPIHGQPPALLPPAPLRRGPACSRCRRDGCDPSMCIRRRDKDGNELPRLEPDEYRRRKDLQRARDPAAAPAVAAIMTDDTDESSSSAFFTTSDSESDHDGYCAAVMDSPEVSPSSLRFLLATQAVLLPYRRTTHAMNFASTAPFSKLAISAARFLVQLKIGNLSRTPLRMLWTLFPLHRSISRAMWRRTRVQNDNARCPCSSRQKGNGNLPRACWPLQQCPLMPTFSPPRRCFQACCPQARQPFYCPIFWFPRLSSWQCFAWWRPSPGAAQLRVAQLFLPVPTRHLLLCFSFSTSHSPPSLLLRTLSRPSLSLHFYLACSVRLLKFLHIATMLFHRTSCQVCLFFALRHYHPSSPRLFFFCHCFPHAIHSRELSNLPSFLACFVLSQNSCCVAVTWKPTLVLLQFLGTATRLYRRCFQLTLMEKTVSKFLNHGLGLEYHFSFCLDWTASFCFTCATRL